MGHTCREPNEIELTAAHGLIYRTLSNPRGQHAVNTTPARGQHDVSTPSASGQRVVSTDLAGVADDCVDGGVVPAMRKSERESKKLL